MNTLASGLSYFDLNFLNTSGVIATVVVHSAGGVAIIDPGPSTTLPALRAGLAGAGIGIGDVRSIVLTHIHLDHAGATGTLVRENPSLRVYVHEKGAPHLVDPSKLVASATRLWGDDMARLWGDVLPVPAAALTVLAGGERIAAGGRDFEVAYTPGHAPAASTCRRRRRPISTSTRGATASRQSRTGGRHPCSSRTSDRSRLSART
jgi:glyoxylase-like metal-dependent hydrolase (beta-lactamase superfamily II)